MKIDNNNNYPSSAFESDVCTTVINDYDESEMIFYIVKTRIYIDNNVMISYFYREN